MSAWAAVLFTAFITVMAGFRIPDWSIVAECAVAVVEVPFVWIAVVAIGVVGIAEWRAGRWVG